MKVLKWVIGLPVGLFVAVFLVFFIKEFASPTPGAEEQYRKDKVSRCSEAIMSNLGTNTSNYTDKRAYDQHVEENCKGFDLKKK